MVTKVSSCQPLLNIECSKCVCRSFMIFLNLVARKNGFYGNKMENQYLSLLQVYKVQICCQEACIKRNFYFLSQTKLQNMNNFALIVVFCIFQNQIPNFSSIWYFYILFVSKYCVIKMHFLDHLPDTFKWYALFWHKKFLSLSSKISTVRPKS